MKACRGSNTEWKHWENRCIRSRFIHLTVCFDRLMSNSALLRLLFLLRMWGGYQSDSFIFWQKVQWVLLYWVSGDEGRSVSQSESAACKHTKMHREFVEPNKPEEHTVGVAALAWFCILPNEGHWRMFERIWEDIQKNATHANTHDLLLPMFISISRLCFMRHFS